MPHLKQLEKEEMKNPRVSRGRKETEVARRIKGGNEKERKKVGQK